MTTYRDEPQTCAICGKLVPCFVLDSTNSFGSPDLDLRPAEMERSTMDAWLHECPQCRYVNGDLEQSMPNAKTIVESSEYQQIANDAQIPQTARKFACFALLNADDINTSGIALIRSAWVCDDEGCSDRAVAYRSQAANLLLSMQPPEFDEHVESLATALVDVLRRALRFSEAKELAETLLSLQTESANETIGVILRYQCRLCESKDAACYTVADAMASV